jgi:hypothetical protein
MRTYPSSEPDVFRFAGPCLNLFSEWLTHQHRDTLSSIVGHPTLTSYLAIADGEAIGRVKFEMTEVCPIYSGFLTHIYRVFSGCYGPADRPLKRMKIDKDFLFGGRGKLRVYL